MKIYKPFLVVIFCIYFFGCSTTDKEVSDDNTSIEEKVIPAKQIPLAPGSALTSLELISTNNKETEYICLFKVKEVKGYGPSTKPLAIGEEIKVSISKNLLSRHNLKISEVLVKGTALKMTIQHIGQVANLKPTVSWQTVKIN